MNRRNFIKLSAAGVFLSALRLNAVVPAPVNDEKGYTEKKFEQIIKKAERDNWNLLPIGDLIVQIADQFMGIPYIGGTLEGNPEMCRINFEGLDCVTFYESSLAIARVIKKGKKLFSDLTDELTFIRYRGGILTDYSSRLHYTSDWIIDNQNKLVVENISKDLGGKLLGQHVDFMSEHPQYYPALKDNPEMVDKIAGFESLINKEKIYFIPLDSVGSVSGKIRTGDIIAITTSKKGLDYSHTGLINKIGDTARFFHASSAKKKVVLDRAVEEYLKSVKTNTGISVLRPLELQGY